MIKVLNDVDSTEVENNWEVTKSDSEVFPYLIVDNWYNEEEQESVWKELDFYSSCPKSKIPRAEDKDSPVSRDTDGIARSKAFRFHLWDIYVTPQGRGYSNILRNMYKQRSPEFHKMVKDALPIHYESFTGTNTDSTFISYYEDGDLYKPHIDSLQFTCLIWMFREPKYFTGGDLRLTQYDKIINIKNNRMLLFPSYFKHQVLPVKFEKETEETGLGRYCITHFYNWESKNG